VTVRPPRGRGGAGRWFAASVVVVGVSLLAGALAQSATRLLLTRSDADIEIVNAGLASEGARSILRLSGCVEEDASLRSNLFYAPGGGVTARIARGEGEDAVVAAPLMIVLQPEVVEGEVQVEDGETLEALDASTGFGRPPCLEEVVWASPPRVVLEQGRTTAVGARFFLDQGEDVATMDGPIALTRLPQGDGPTVEATAEGLRYDLEAGRSTLSGGVQVTAGSRVSEAEELELDEEAGVAILTGNPAVSRDGEDEVRGDRLVYDLETNDVVVEGRVRGSFNLGE